MNSVQVKGRFLDENGNPAPEKARIQFIPSRLWVNEDGISYGTLSVDTELVDGRFCVELTPTTGHDDIPWTYTVICPVGRWTVCIPDTDKTLLLRDVLPSRFKQ